MKEDQPQLVYGNAQDTSALSRLDIGPWIQVVLERVWIVVAVAVLIGGLGTLWAIKQQDTYRSVSTLLVPQEDLKIIPGVDVNAEEVKSLEALNTIAQRLRQSSVLLRVVKANNLTNHIALRNRLGDRPTETQAANALLAMVKTKVRPNTRLIDISVEHRSPELTELVANAVATEFLRENAELKQGGNRSVSADLLEEAEKLKKKVEASERALQDYKEKHNAGSLENQQNTVLDNLKKLNEDFTAAKSARVQFETDLQQIEKLGTNTAAMLELPSVLRDQAVQAMRGKVIDQETLVASMTNKYLPKYPKMAQAIKQLDDLRNSLNAMVLATRSSIQLAAEAAANREKALAKAVEEAEKANLAMGRLSIDYNILVRQMESERALYESVLKRWKETDLTQGLEKNAITVSELAVRPNQPYKPDRPKIIVGACVGGLLAGIALAMFLNFIDNSIKTVDDAETMLQLPVIGAVPLDKLAHQKKDRRVVLEEPHSTCAESYRSLVAAIDMTGRLEEQKIVLFTSAIPGEGKTFSSVNYSIAHAQKGRKTLLIDFDLRRPSVGPSFQFESDHPGVSDYLLGKKTLDQLVTSIPGVDNFHVIPTGPRIPNPAEQIAKPWLAELLKEAMQKYDRIVLDTPPMNAVADTNYLLPFAHVVCLVVRCGKTPVKAVRRTLQVMQRCGTTPSGLVLNCLPERSGYGYYYYYHYGSKDGYYSKGVYGFEGDEKSSKKNGKAKLHATNGAATAPSRMVTTETTRSDKPGV